VNRSASLSRLGTDIGESRGSALKHGSTSAESRRLGTSVARRHGPNPDGLTCSDRFVALALWKNQKDCVLDALAKSQKRTKCLPTTAANVNLRMLFMAVVLVSIELFNESKSCREVVQKRLNERVNHEVGRMRVDGRRRRRKVRLRQ
jgi:hypothetical protein